MNDLPDYIVENYGLCTEKTCKCLKTGWLGERCPNWKPIGAKDWDELRKKMGA